jgi:hypothetical protein
MSDLRTAAQLAVTMLKTGMPEYDARDVLEVLEAALEQKPKFTLSCGCPSQYGGVPAYWERDGSTAFGAICEKHWHEYGARSEA